MMCPHQAAGLQADRGRSRARHRSAGAPGWAGERGFVLTLVLVVFLFIELVIVGALSVVLSDLHGAVAGQLAMQSIAVAEAGLNYGVAQLVSRTEAAAPTDEAYAGEADDIILTGGSGRPLGIFHLTVACVYPSGLLPPDCQDDPNTAAVDERDVRLIRSTGFVPARPGRARRQVEATVRRYSITPGDVNVFGICGRDDVELVESTVRADVGSNADIILDGPQRPPGTVAGRFPRAPSLAPLAEAVAPTRTPGLTGLYTWRVTFLDAQGEESGGSPPTPPVLLTEQHAQLTDIPLGDSSSIVRRRVYRTPASSPRGPWFLVGELPENTIREYTDSQPDEALRWPIPGAIGGSVTAAGHVSCSRSCASQVDGHTRPNLREVPCPNFLAPAAQSGHEPAPDPIVQTEADQTMHWGALHVRQDEGFTVQTLSTPNARLHIHVTEIILDRGARLAVTGAGTVYFHVGGTFILNPDAVFGAIDFSGNLLRPADRIHVLVDSRDPAFLESGVASVRWEGDNKVAAVIFAPNANITIDGATAFRGGLYGRYIRISRSGGIFLDPTEGLGSQKSVVRPSPFQYVLRWYDNPRPGAER